MKRLLMALSTAALLAWGAAPAGAVPNIYHPISSTNGFAQVAAAVPGVVLL